MCWYVCNVFLIKKSKKKQKQSNISIIILILILYPGIDKTLPD